MLVELPCDPEARDLDGHVRFVAAPGDLGADIEVRDRAGTVLARFVLTLEELHRLAVVKMSAVLSKSVTRFQGPAWIVTGENDAGTSTTDRDDSHSLPRGQTEVLARDVLPSGGDRQRAGDGSDG